MATHVNAYVEELEKARDAAVRALGEYEAAKVELKTHPDYEAGMLVRLPFELLYPEPPKPEVAKSEPQAKTARETRV